MATIRKCVRSKYWFAAFRGADGEQYTRSTKIVWKADSAAERAAQSRKAQQVANKFEELARGLAPDAAAVRKTALEVAKIAGGKATVPTVKAFFADWLQSAEANGLSPSSLTRYKQVAEQFCAFVGVKLFVDLVTPSTVQGYVDNLLGTGLTRKTAMNHLRIIRIPFERALKLGELPNNPAAGATVKNVKAAMAEKRPFTSEELSKVLQVAKGSEWETATFIGYFTGLRMGDALALEWGSLNLGEGVLDVTTSKTNTKARLPLHPALLRHLRSIHRSGACGYVLPVLGAMADGGKRSALSKQFKAMMKKAGVESVAVGGGQRKVMDLGFHCLRHSLVSHLASAGAPEAVRMHLATHSDRNTHAGYTHANLNAMREALNLLPELEVATA